LAIFGYTNNSVYNSTNTGVNWNSLFTSSGWNVNCLEVDPSNNSIIYAGCTNGLWRSNNSGANFSKYFNVYPNSTNVLNVLKDPSTGDTVYTVTPKGIFRIWGTLVDVQNISTFVPDKFEISSVYPNPFNPSATVKFTLNKDEFIKLSVNDITGREVYDVFSEFREAGEHNVRLNTESLSSGIYFCVLKSYNQLSVKKIVLLK
jgi:hypothetical protein